MPEEAEDADETECFEVSYEEVLSGTISVRAESREEAWEALEAGGKSAEAQEAIINASGSPTETKPVDIRTAPEVAEEDGDVDLDLTE